jgi:hypothetical protein
MRKQLDELEDEIDSKRLLKNRKMTTKSGGIQNEDGSYKRENISSRISMESQSDLSVSHPLSMSCMLQPNG